MKFGGVKMRRKWLLFPLFLVIFVSFLGIISCAPQEPEIENPPLPPKEAETPAWMKTELKDVATGDTFRISDFKGRTILLESFAVWCPTCLAQQKEMKKLVETEGEAIVHISLNTDPNEDKERVRGHIERNELDWYFAVSPEDMTNALIDEFGLSFVSAPTAPVALICEDQSSRLLPRGLKSADELLSEIKNGCD